MEKFLQGNSYGFFQWHDEAMNARSRDIINQLKIENKILKIENRQLKVVNNRNQHSSDMNVGNCRTLA